MFDGIPDDFADGIGQSVKQRPTVCLRQNTRKLPGLSLNDLAHIDPSFRSIAL